MIYNLPIQIHSQAKYISTDSRNVLFPNETIFFSIKGINQDGHHFIKDLYLSGVRDFVIEKQSATPYFLDSISFFENTNLWVVPNSIEALQNFVAAKRQKFNLDLVAITGSNGKTIVKEWLAQLLSAQYNIVKSPKSYNSQLGVPLSVWQINETHNLGIFEAGISKPGEMLKLEKVIKPTIGIITNIGTAHDEFFENKATKIREKLLLFKNSKLLIYCLDDKILETEVQNFINKTNPNCEIIGWSASDTSHAKVKITALNKHEVQYFSNTINGNIQIPFIDEASKQNIGHCIVLMVKLGISLEEINKKIKKLKPVSMRLELKEGIENAHLIDDTYNNDLIGLKLAVEFLSQQNQHKKRILILSDLLQTGEEENVLYQSISKLIEVNKIDLLIGVGPIISKNAYFFKPNSLFFANTELLLEQLSLLPLADATILVKGARPFLFEKVIHQLQAKNHETFLEINLDAVVQNLNFYKKKLEKTTRIMAMVKAFAYGLGNKEIANLLQNHQADYLGVAYGDEGVFLRENGISLPIMVMNPTINDFQKIIDYALEPEIYSLDKLKNFVEFMENQSGFAKIHLKIDTGMHRLGFEEKDLDMVIAILKQNPNIIVASIFSHLVASENIELDEFTKNQAELFRKMFQKISTQIGYTPLSHILNSAGISRFKEHQMDMVRLGIGLYGIGATGQDKAELQLVCTLRSTISQIKEISAGDTVGYGRKGVVSKPSKIATIAIGYADGYNRRFGNGVGHIEVNGHLCPTIGNICMDMTMIDITGIEAQEGDTVTIFGERPSAYELANQIGTIPYEILTNVGERVKRVFYKV